MRKSTFNRTCTLFIISLFIVLFFICEIPQKFSDAVEGFSLLREERLVYTDIPIDILSDVDILTNNVTSIDLCTTSNLTDDVISSGAALVSNRNAVKDKFQNSALVGYYSNTFFMTKALSQELGQTYKNQLDNDVCMIDFNQIFEGFMDDKSWSDLGYNIEGKINIEAFYQNKNDVYYKLLTQQILSAISGEVHLTKDIYSQYDTELNNALEKINKATTHELKDGTIYICCEQSQTFKGLIKNYIPAYSDIIACVPICFYWNFEALEPYSETLQDGYHSLFKNFGFRNPTNSQYSESADGYDSQIRSYQEIPHNEYAMDSVYMAVDAE